MPRQVGQRSTDYTGSAPPRAPGAIIRVEPFSPWQMMIENFRVSADPPVSLDALQAASKIPKATLFNWLRSPEGAPPRKRYTANLNRRLALAIKVDPRELAEAYDAARKRFNPRAPESGTKPLNELRSLVSKSRRRHWTRDQLLTEIDRLTAAAQSSKNG